VVLYGCEILSLTSREEYGPKVSENSMLRRIFGPKRGEVTGGWKKLRNEELRNLYSWLSIIRMVKSRKMIWVGLVVRMGTRGLLIRYWWKSQKERATEDNYMYTGL
jgi:hypothetical protein